MSKRWFKLVFAGCLILFVALGLGMHANIIRLPLMRSIEAQWLSGLDDDRVLMGAAHNVFVGKVVRQVANVNTDIGPFTRFEVAVVDNIKGDFGSTEMIMQQGGYRDGILYVVEEDPLLVPGSTYLLVSRTGLDGTQTWHVLNGYPGARKLISQDASLSTTQLLPIAQVDERVKQLQAAYPNEILLDADIANNHALNSYESLH
jgi:hypothetical protein